jgi:hypothetical protein
MTATLPAGGRWAKVEQTTSLCLQLVLLSFIGSRLSFAAWWPLPTLDFVVSALAVLLLAISLRVARGRPQRTWRLGVIAYASATQLLPMVCREPALLLPLLGALIPVVILAGCLFALSRKPSTVRQPGRS